MRATLHISKFDDRARGRLVEQELVVTAANLSGTKANLSVGILNAQCIVASGEVDDDSVDFCTIEVKDDIGSIT